MMAFERSFDSDERPMAEINMTPLVDVMLVLLIIFMVTAPLFTHAVRIDLPRARSAPSADKPQIVTLALDAAGTLRWNDEVLDEAALAQRLSDAATRDPQPEMHLRADRATRYERIAQLLSQIRGAGVARLAIVTDPSEAP
jgi:biopolymer transport protein ExbD